MILRQMGVPCRYVSGYCAKDSAQVGVAALVSLADCATANNTVAIIVSGPMAKNMSRIHKVDPRRTASLPVSYTHLDVYKRQVQQRHRPLQGWVAVPSLRQPLYREVPGL